MASRAQTLHRSSALLDHLARLMRLRAESAIAPLGLRPRYLVFLTVLREQGSPTQQALAAALQTDRTNLTRSERVAREHPARGTGRLIVVRDLGRWPAPQARDRPWPVRRYLTILMIRT